MVLGDVKENEEVLIKKVNCDESIKRRLYDLGFMPNSRVKCVFISPFSSPLAFLVRGSVIALRKKDIERIEVLKI